MLSPYRVLDLTDEKGLLCGKLLGDLGADVIKVERPGGDLARKIGPFYHDEVDPEKSLFWLAFNTSKRGITLDIETASGQELFRSMVKSADFVIESFRPGYLDKLGLGYKALEKINPGIIMVSITPFGQSGPYRDYKAPDIVAWAMGGQMYRFGDVDRPPVRISHHSQSYLHAGAEAAVGAILALYHREMTGEGQQIDVSVHEVVAGSHDRPLAYWDMQKVHQRRGDVGQRNVNLRQVWPCKDGFVAWVYWTGPNAIRWNMPLIEWMDKEGVADDFIKQFDWLNADFNTVKQEQVDRWQAPTIRFFMSHTKAELMEGAVQRGIMLYPVSTVSDILKSVQLVARDFWTKLEQPELGGTITYPGAFVKSSEAPLKVSRRAPRIGEHNRELLEKELGLSSEKVAAFRQLQGKLAGTGDKSTAPAKKILEGIRVADFSWWGTVPLATRILADYGAEVIRIEGKSKPDLQRLTAPFKDGIIGPNRGVFNQLNTSKLSVALNLANPKGVEIARKFIARADIVVENLRPGVMEKFGLGYQQLRQIKPDIIMLSSCMQGQTGPHAYQIGFGMHLTPLTGFNNIAGWPDREPAWLEFYTDYVAPYFNALAILSALDYRRRTGKGQYIDASQYENGVHFLAPLVLDYEVNGRVANRMGNRAVDAAPHGAYRCCGKDRWCVIAVFTDEEWRSFSSVIGKPAWVNDPRFSTLQTRKENEDELDRLVEDWTVRHSPEDVMSLMQTAGVAAGVIETGEDMVEHDLQLRHRHFFWEVAHAELGKFIAPRPAFILSKSPCEVRSAPLLGEHNEYALKELLGMSDEEVAQMIIEGVLE